MLAGDASALAELLDRQAQLLGLYTEVALEEAGDGTIHLDEGEEEVLEGNVLVLHIGGDILRLVQHLIGLAGEVGVATRYLG